MQVHLLRHAKTMKHSPTGKDFDRELLPRGYEQIEALKEFFKEHPIAPRHILCSSAVRTKQTFAQLQTLWPQAQILFKDELYLANRQEILSAICALSSHEDILLVGHNEGLSELAIYFTDVALWLKTCGFVSLDFPFENTAYCSENTAKVNKRFRTQ